MLLLGSRYYLREEGGGWCFQNSTVWELVLYRLVSTTMLNCSCSEGLEERTAPGLTGKENVTRLKLD